MGKKIVREKPDIAEQLWTSAINCWLNDRWIDQSIKDAGADSTGAFADAGAALRRLFATGASRNDLARLARFIAYESTFTALTELSTAGLKSSEIGAISEQLLSADPDDAEGKPVILNQESAASAPAGATLTEWPAVLKKACEIEFDSSGEFLAVGRTSSSAGSVEIYRKGVSTPVAFPVLKNLRRFAFTKQADSLLVANHDGLVARFDASTGKEQWRSTSLKFEIGQLVLLDSQNLLMASGIGNEILFLDLKTGENAGSIAFQPERQTIEPLMFPGNTQILVVLSSGPVDSNRLAVVDIESRKIVRSVPLGQMMGRPAICKRSNRIFSGFMKSLIEVNPDTGKVETRLNFDSPPAGIAISPDDKQMAVSVGDTVLLIDTSTFAIIASQPCEWAGGSRFSPDGRYLVLQSRAKTSSIKLLTQVLSSAD